MSDSNYVSAMPNEDSCRSLLIEESGKSGLMQSRYPNQNTGIMRKAEKT